METKYIMCTFPETQLFMDHPRWGECIFALEITGHPCPDSTFFIPEDIYNEVIDVDNYRIS